MKKTILLFISIFLLNASGYAQLFEGKAGNLDWIIDYDGPGKILCIMGEGAIPDYKFGEAPWYSHRSDITYIYIAEGVTRIGDQSFCNFDNVTEVYITPSVTSIGGWAFQGCRNLTNIEIPHFVTSMGDYVFNNCYNLKEVILSESLISLGRTLNNCGLVSIILPSSLKSIDARAFASCYSLESVSIPNSVESIAASAFSDCSLTTISVDKNSRFFTDVDGILFTKDMTAILKFPKNKDFKKYTIPNTTTKIGVEAFYDCELLTDITIPNSVKIIEDAAFYGCTEIKKIIIPDFVESIGIYAFARCEGITSIVIPPNVEYIGYSAFNECSNLEYIFVNEKNTHYADEDGVLFNKDKSTILKFPSKKSIDKYTIPGSVKIINTYAFLACFDLADITIPNSVTRIGGFAFQGCINLTSIQIGNSVTEIGGNAFAYCEKLTAIKIPNSVKIIEDNTFSYCRSLASVDIPNSITSIKYQAFLNCTSLTSITIPESVISMGIGAFDGCTGLKSVTVNWNTPLSITDNVFYSVNINIATLKVPTGTSSRYKTADVWKNFGKIEEHSGGTGNEDIITPPIRVFAAEGSIYIESPSAEIIDIYSINGAKLYSARKTIGEIRTPAIQKGILIVKSSSGWIRKIMNK